VWEYGLKCAENVFVKRQKIIVGSVIHAAELNWKYFFFLREAFCGLEYTENAFADLTEGAQSRRSARSSSRLGRGHPSPDPTPLGASTLAPPALGSVPWHISGYATAPLESPQRSTDFLAGLGGHFFARGGGG